MRQNRWLHSWIDEYGLTEIQQVKNLLKSKPRWERLLAYARAHEDEPEVSHPGAKSIVAGRAFDLTSFLACGHPDCLVRQLDNLFAHVWHYFDTIAVVGADSHRFLELVEEGSIASARRMAVAMATVVFHSRKTGAEKFLLFIDKPPACGVHWPEFHDLHEMHLSDDQASNVVQQMLRNGDVQYKQDGRHARFVYRGTGLSSGSESIPANWVLDSKHSDAPVNERVVRQVLSRYTLSAASDLFASERMGLPLGVGVEMESRLLGMLRPTATEEQIAFNLQLPVLKDVGIADLLALRESERDAFDSFRLGLAQAMRARLQADGSKDPAEIAREVENDFIEPALVDLQRQLDIASKALKQKRVVTGGLVGLATVCGLLGVAPAAAALGVAALGNGVPTEMKAIENNASLQGSNMYFLWKVRHNVSRTESRKKRRR